MGQNHDEGKRVQHVLLPPGVNLSVGSLVYASDV